MPCPSTRTRSGFAPSFSQAASSAGYLAEAEQAGDVGHRRPRRGARGLDDAKLGEGERHHGGEDALLGIEAVAADVHAAEEAHLAEGVLLHHALRERDLRAPRCCRVRRVEPFGGDRPRRHAASSRIAATRRFEVVPLHGFVVGRRAVRGRERVGVEASARCPQAGVAREAIHQRLAARSVEEDRGYALRPDVADQRGHLRRGGLAASIDALRREESNAVGGAEIGEGVVRGDGDPPLRRDFPDALPHMVVQRREAGAVGLGGLAPRRRARRIALRKPLADAGGVDAGAPDILPGVGVRRIGAPWPCDEVAVLIAATPSLAVTRMPRWPALRSSRSSQGSKPRPLRTITAAPRSASASEGRG